MKKLNILIKALLSVIVSITCQCAYSQITVVDANDNLPVISASIYNGNGTDVIGITDYDGKLPKAAEQANRKRKHKHDTNESNASGQAKL